MRDKCKNCGAEIEYAASIQSLKCPYCDTVNEIKKPENALPQQVDLIIPLALSVEQLESQVYAFMASGHYTPDDMLEAATLIQRERFYVPAYRFAIEYEATWTASFGYDRQEPYTSYRTVTVNGQSRQEAYTAYRTVTDWRPANGVDAGTFVVSAYAGQSLAKSALTPADIVSEVAAAATPTAFNASFMTGLNTEDFSISASQAFQTLGGKIDNMIGDKVKAHAQGDRQQDWRWNAKTSHVGNTVYVPLTHVVFDYKGREYHYWADGASGKTMRADPLPEDDDRKQLVNKGFVPVGLAAVGVAASSALWSFSWASLAAVVALGGYGLLRRSAILGYSKSIRESLLLQRQASSTATTRLSAEEQDKFTRAFQKPEKPFLAKTNHDYALIPLLASAAMVMSLAPSYLGRHHVAAVVAPHAVSQTVTPHADLSPKVVSPVSNTPNPPVTPPVATVSSGLSEPLRVLLTKAEHTQWSEIDGAAAEIRQHAPSVDKGDRKLSRSLNQEATALLKKGNKVGAIEVLQRGLEADPSDIETKNDLAYALLLHGDLAPAETLLNEVLLKVPSRSAAWMNLSELYARKGAEHANSSLSAMRLAVYFSRDRQRLSARLKHAAQDHSVALYRDTATKVMQEMGSIPEKVS